MNNLLKLRENLKKLPFDNFWQIGETTGAFLRDLIIENSYTNILEVGTSSGYSATWLLEGLQNQGESFLTCIESHKERHELATQNLTSVCPDNVSLNVVLSHAPECFQSGLNLKYDLVFIDATKRQTIEIFELLYSNLNQGGSIVVDNVLSHLEKMQPFLDYLESQSINFDLHQFDAGVVHVKKN